MRDTDSNDRDQGAGDEIDITSDNPSNTKPRGGDRREGFGLFGGYQGPERRSGRDRRERA